MIVNAIASSSRIAGRRVGVRAVCAELPVRLRSLHVSARASRDLGAKFRRPLSIETSDERVVRKSEVGAVQPSPDPNAGRRNKFVTVEGVRIPPKPIPPGDEDCCMSGCVHCVLTLYADDVLEYNGAMAEAEGKLTARGVPRNQWPKVMDEADESAAADEPKVELDPAMAAFMEFEAKMNKKKRAEQADHVANDVDPLLTSFGGPSVARKQPGV